MKIISIITSGWRKTYQIYFKHFNPSWNEVQSTDGIQNAGKQVKNVVLVLYKGLVVKYKLSQRQERKTDGVEVRAFIRDL